MRWKTNEGYVKVHVVACGYGKFMVVIWWGWIII